MESKRPPGHRKRPGVTSRPRLLLLQPLLDTQLSIGQISLENGYFRLPFHSGRHQHLKGGY